VIGWATGHTEGSAHVQLEPAAKEEVTVALGDAPSEDDEEPADDSPHSFGSRPDGTREEFGGIGAGLKASPDGNALVNFVMEGGPAFAAGLQDNDEIVAVNGSAVGGSPLNAIVEQIRGPIGTPVVLSVLRGGAGPFDVYVERDRIVL
jgi:carboxyl-terminal processing protease